MKYTLEDMPGNGPMDKRMNWALYRRGVLDDRWVEKCREMCRKRLAVKVLKVEITTKSDPFARENRD